MAEHVAGELDAHHLHPQAEPQIRDVMLASILRRRDLALDAALAEAAGHKDAIGAGQRRQSLGPLSRLRVHPGDLHIVIQRPCGMAQRLAHAHVGILKLDVLAHECDLDACLVLVDLVDQAAPLGQVRAGHIEFEPLRNEVGHALLLEHQRNLVDALGSVGRDDRARIYVGEQRDLFPHALAYR